MLEFKNYRNIRIENQIFIKPEYKSHPYISGNKWRKLKYNLIEARHRNIDTLLTFGGAYSNHIAAVASAGREYGFKTIGVIRGEELNDKIEQNSTLRFSKKCAMQFKFVSRGIYREKSSRSFIQELEEEFGEFYLVPEGGTNDLAVKGCEEILSEADKDFDYVCCAVGTGGTISGIINSSNPRQKIIGFPALKGDFLTKDISKFASNTNWELNTDYHFGGYAKINKELISFINQFKRQYNIPLDPIYTGKMMYGIFDLIKTGYFKKEDRILAIHTGGLQGIEGINKILRKKQWPVIN